MRNTVPLFLFMSVAAGVASAFVLPSARLQRASSSQLQDLVAPTALRAAPTQQEAHVTSSRSSNKLQNLAGPAATALAGWALVAQLATAVDLPDQQLRGK